MVQQAILYLAGPFMEGAANTIDNNTVHWLGGHSSLWLHDFGGRLRPDQDVNVRGEGGVTALHVAAEVGNLRTVQRLVQSRADVNAINDHGRTPLMVAQFHRRADVAVYLVRHEQLVRALTQYLIETRPGKTPTPNQIHGVLFVMKLSNFRYDVCNRMKVEGDKLVAAARASDWGAVRLLVERVEVHIDSLDSTTNETALSAGLTRGRLFVCDYLMARGAHTRGRCIINGRIQSALSPAVRGGNVNFVKRLLTHGVRMSTPLLDCPLSDGIQSGSSEMVDVLLDAGTQFNARADSKRFAASVIRSMEGSDLPAEDKPVWQRLYLACWQQDLVRVQYLCDTYKELQDREMMATKGADALFLTVYQQNDEIVVELLGRGVEINSVGACGVTSMVAAVFVNSLRMLRFCVDRGGDVRAVHVSVDYGFGQSMSLLVAAIYAGTMDCAHFLLQTETRTEHLDRALRLAIQRDDQDFVIRLLDIALPSTQDTLLWCASETRSPAMLDLLLTRCCAERYSISCSSVVRAFWLACRQAEVSTVTVLLARGIDVNARNAVGTTLTHATSSFYEKWPEVVDLLVDAGADVNAKDVHGRTPLDIVNERLRSNSLALDIRARYEAGRDILEGCCSSTKTGCCPTLRHDTTQLLNTVRLLSVTVVRARDQFSNANDGNSPAPLRFTRVVLCMRIRPLWARRCIELGLGLVVGAFCSFCGSPSPRQNDSSR